MRGTFCLLKFIFLSEEFYSNYKGCKEIEQKTDRPYIMVCVQIGGVLFAVPMRSHIKHKYALWTDKENHCGVDFSKAVVIVKESYIEQGIVPHIRQAEFDSLRGKDMLIVQRMKQYISIYRKAKKRLDVPRNRTICEYSTLQYFEDYI